MSQNNAQDSSMHVHMVQHRYDIGDRSAYVSVPEGLPVHEIAAYLQYKAEHWFGDSVGVENTGVVDALKTFYGCADAVQPKGPIADERIIDMYWVREELDIDDYRRVVTEDLHARDGLQEFMSTRYWD